MTGRGKLMGSYTVEAAWVTAVVLFSITSMFQAAYGLRGRVVKTMVLHEAVEVARHEKQMRTDDIKAIFSGAASGIELGERGDMIRGKARSGRWEAEITGHKFRPESFLRKITLLEQLEEGNGGSL